MNEQLRAYRQDIDELDIKILDLLAKRFEIVKNVGHLKTSENIEIIQSKRAKEVIDNVRKMATERGISAQLLENFYTAMIEEAHRIEFAIKDTA